MKYLPFLLLLICSSCATSRFIKKELPQSIKETPAFEDSFTGFMLFDPVENQSLYEYQSDKYFTPASNTKILTLYAALQILEKGIPTLSYVEQGDSLFFWGMGNPVFLDERFEGSEAVFSFLQNSDKQLIFCDDNYTDERFGAGWAWDDYGYGFQAEKSAFPIYGNLVKVEKESDELNISPSVFTRTFRYNPAMRNARPSVTRLENENTFEYNKALQKATSFSKYYPFKTSSEAFAQLLADTLNRKVIYQARTQNLTNEAKTLYSTVAIDSVFKTMMQESDNFIAEQLLLTCSAELDGIQNTRNVINYLKEKHFAFTPDELIWRDGSGLSRYNLFTPRSVVSILNKLHEQLPEERLFDIFPAGGRDGTIEHWYGAGEPYVFAKTGTLSNRHCLSGYIKTKSGKTLIFSFMHNNYTNGSTLLKTEMEKVLRRIWEVY